MQHQYWILVILSLDVKKEFSMTENLFSYLIYHIFPWGVSQQPWANSVFFIIQFSAQIRIVNTIHFFV